MLERKTQESNSPGNGHTITPSMDCQIISAVNPNLQGGESTITRKFKKRDTSRGMPQKRSGGKRRSPGHESNSDLVDFLREGHQAGPNET